MESLFWITMLWPFALVLAALLLGWFVVRTWLSGRLDGRGQARRPKGYRPQHSRSEHESDSAR